ncbi:sensor histidine kinase [Streptomyces fuscigenes]|uniref:sensor histidine kinase n=1 Tax=Streptomyces fuscigenes TaxID=1528880 RepID=UPI001F1FBE9A|nr:sensor histidine kinase [Streptomyces fuscigenes]MCF3960865.1 histidine kinase [Streptomyces fuscigenes]
MEPSSGLWRRGPLVLEIAVLAAASVVDALLTQAWGGPDHGWQQPVAALLPSLGPAAGLLVLLRRRFPDRLVRLALWAAGTSLVCSAVSLLAEWLGGFGHRSCACEVVALTLFSAASARRLRPRPSAVLALVCGVAAVSAALSNTQGTAGRWAAVAAAALWSASVGVGLLLRDADRRRDTDLAAASAAQRAALARDLHDVVAHHVSGIVVLARAARHAGPPAPTTGASGPDEASGYEQIERAGAEALSAMRKLVSLLRTEPDSALTTLRDALEDPARSEPRARLRLADDLDAGPEDTRAVAAVVRRVAVEALTNVRRHAPDATDVLVSAQVLRVDARATLLIDITNDGVAAPAAWDPAAATGHGLAGMAERVTAFGGTCEAGSAGEGHWSVAIRLPLPPPREGPLFLGQRAGRPT